MEDKILIEFDGNKEKETVSIIGHANDTQLHIAILALIETVANRMRIPQSAIAMAILHLIDDWEREDLKNGKKE